MDLTPNLEKHAKFNLGYMGIFLSKSGNPIEKLVFQGKLDRPVGISFIKKQKNWIYSNYYG